MSFLTITWDGIRAGVSGSSLVGTDLTCADLSRANLGRVSAYDLKGCPERLPDQWKCVRQPSNGRFALIGPWADLSEADLTGADLTSTHFDDAVVRPGTRAQDLLGCPETLVDTGRTCVDQPANGRHALIGPSADLSGADLSGADLSGLALGGATLDRVSLRGAKMGRAHAEFLPACPDVLPSERFKCIVQPSFRDRTVYAIVGPGMDLTYADLMGADLTGTDLSGATGASAYDLPGCPAVLPGAGWKCLLAGKGYALLGPGAHLIGADLTDVDLTGIDLGGAEVSLLRRCPRTLPNGSWECISQPQGPLQPDTYALVGPGVQLVDYRGADLTGADLTGAIVGPRSVTYDLRGCPSKLPGKGWKCAAQPATGRYALVGPGVYLGDSDLTSADLSGADLRGALFISSNGVLLRNAKLNGANLSGTDLTRVSLLGADLTGANLEHARLWEYATAYDLIGCPASLPDPAWTCVAQPANGRYALVGPGAPTGNADLTGADLRGASTGDLISCPEKLPSSFSCIEKPVQLDFAARLNTISFDRTPVLGCPGSLPDPSLVCVHEGYSEFAKLPRYALAGPGVNWNGADLRGASLLGANLEGADLSGAATYDLHGCPEKLPSSEWTCSGSLLAGPGTNLSGADLTGRDLSGVDLTRADLTYCKAFDLLGCPAHLPGPLWSCIVQPANGKHALIGPSVNLADADLSRADLTNADLSAANLTGTNLTSAKLRGANLAAVVWANTICPDRVNSADAGNDCASHL